MDDAEMETASPSYFDPEDLTTREQFRRYGKRLSTSPLQDISVSKFSESRLIYDGNSIQRRPNAALFLEEIKQEVENFEIDGLDAKAPHSSRRRTVFDSHGVSELDGDFESIRRARSPIKSGKHEDDVLADGGETTFMLFASLFDSALQGLMSFPDLILRFEDTCRNVSESIRYGNTGRHRVMEDKLMRQKAQLLLDEAASWSLLWYLFGKGSQSLSAKKILYLFV